MAIEFNHTVVAARDKDRSAAFLAEVLGLPEPSAFGPFAVVETSNGVSLDFFATDGPVLSQHYAFLISEAEFDAVWDRLRARDITYYADPGHKEAGTINRNDGGRGMYFADPDGHNLEVITRPYGSGEVRS
ncbi:VOC family protein [Nonomuraea sp. NPDC046802]|uniref:VOC family protein n=1 Tax=Nonomuraea sp. NPDC046802 TaxID=3154919 RepID=UPI0033FF96B9